MLMVISAYREDLLRTAEIAGWFEEKRMRHP
jgi:hypothetical protein